MPPVVLDEVRALKEFVGREIGVTGWLSLTQKRIEQFAEATEDRQGFISIMSDQIENHRTARRSPTDF